MTDCDELIPSECSKHQSDHCHHPPRPPARYPPGQWTLPGQFSILHKADEHLSEPVHERRDGQLSGDPAISGGPRRRRTRLQRELQERLETRVSELFT